MQRILEQSEDSPAPAQSYLSFAEHNFATIHQANVVRRFFFSSLYIDAVEDARAITKMLLTGKQFN